MCDGQNGYLIVYMKPIIGNKMVPVGCEFFKDKKDAKRVWKNPPPHCEIYVHGWDGKKSRTVSKEFWK